MGWTNSYKIRMPEAEKAASSELKSILSKFDLAPICGFSYSSKSNENNQLLNELNETMKLKRTDTENIYKAKLSLENKLNFRLETIDTIYKFLMWMQNKSTIGKVSINFSANETLKNPAIHIGVWYNKEKSAHFKKNYPNQQAKHGLFMTIYIPTNDREKALLAYKSFFSELGIPFTLVGDDGKSQVSIKPLSNEKVLFEEANLFPNYSSNFYYFLDLSPEELFANIDQVSAFNPETFSIWFTDLKMEELEILLSNQKELTKGATIQYSGSSQFITSEILTFMENNSKFNGGLSITVDASLKLNQVDRPLSWLEITKKNGQLTTTYTINKNSCDIEKVKQETGLELEYIDTG